MRKLSGRAIDVNLDLPPDRRWCAVTSKDVLAATKLMDEAKAELPPLVRVAAYTFDYLYRASGGLYYEEIEWWARRMRMSSGLLTLLQCMYELSHSSETFSDLVLGCTAAIVRSTKNLCHIRTLDWPLKGIASATRVVRFYRGSRVFYAVNPVGFVGVLSGMLPGAYSVSINYAPPQHVPTFSFSPSLLLRNVLETCDTYADAVYALSHTELSTSVFYTVCGIDKGCVIERTSTDYAIRSLRKDMLVQSNHYVSRKYTQYNAPIQEDTGDGTVFNASIDRQQAMYTARKPREALRQEPVWNSNTQHALHFEPRTGKLEVWVR